MRRIIHLLFKCPMFWRSFLTLDHKFKCPDCGMYYHCYWDGADCRSCQRINICKACARSFHRHGVTS